MRAKISRMAVEPRKRRKFSTAKIKVHTVGNPGDDGIDGSPGDDGRDGSPGPKGRQLNLSTKVIH